MTSAEHEFDEVLKIYLAEAEEQLSEIEKGLVALEQQPEDTEVLQSVFRAAHTLKGNAASVGYNGVADLAHSMEDLLDRLRTTGVPISAAMVTQLLRSVDALRFLVSAAIEDPDLRHPDQAKLIEEITATCALFDQAGPWAPGAPEGSVGRIVDIAGPQTLRVDLSRLDRMLDLSGEIAVAQGRLAELLHRGNEAAIEAYQDANRLFMDLQEEVLRARMVPLGPTFRQQTRTVRDAAQAASKQVRIEIEGGEVEVDAALVESLRAPLTHMIRNAIDHGIESPKARVARDKNPVGTIRLRARHESGGVVIELEDDGAGLDRQRIAAKAKEMALAVHPEAMADSQLMRLIFEPGFSTNQQVTELSGRGIGMDVVRKNVEALRGSVDVSSVSGEGTTFSIRVPLTVAILQGFLFEVGDETYVIRLDAIAECVDLPSNSRQDQLTGLLNLRDHSVPYIRLRKVFGGVEGPGDRESLIVVEDRGRRVALAVDALIGERQLVIKPFAGALRRVAGLSGSTILGNGKVALILDVGALFESAEDGRLGATAPVRNVMSTTAEARQ